MKMPTDNLLDEFPPVSTQKWEEVIRKDLKGADYTRKLLWQTGESFAVKPYYRSEDISELKHLDALPGEFPYLRGSHATGDWRICEQIDAADPEDANRVACEAVIAGAEEIAFIGVAIEDVTDLKTLIANLREVPVRFQNGTEPLIRLLIERLKTQKEKNIVSTSWNPLTNLEFAVEVVATAPSAFVPFSIDGAWFEESGATTVEEVGFTLAAGVDYLAAMQVRGADVTSAASSLTFSFAIGANYFFQIAKLRAFRLLWSQVVESFGGGCDSAKARIYARTSRWNKTIYDPHVNILRGATEAMSAVLGGADSVSIAPFDACYKAPDEASRRIARNTQILLKHEALFSRVADPGGGSNYLESLTDSIARASWECMQEIEARGGYQQVASAGEIVRALEQSMTAREKTVTVRSRLFTGTNKYADASEHALDRIDLSCINAVKRGPKLYEDLRLRTEHHIVKGGKCPRVLLAEFGDVKMSGARANFAANFFACAGFDIHAQRFATPEEIAATNADLIVLCSSDAEYLVLAAFLMPALKAIGSEAPVLIAGRPDTEDQLKAAGIADFVHIRTNPIEFLNDWQHRLRIRD
jgi:methylmalonyl-CoA mutase